MSDHKTQFPTATTELEHVLDDKEMLGRFYEFLSSIYSTESFDFWLEAGSYINSCTFTVLQLVGFGFFQADGRAALGPA
jgi:hypothetical protein